jgi:hypothetical protein
MHELNKHHDNLFILLYMLRASVYVRRKAKRFLAPVEHADNRLLEHISKHEREGCLSSVYRHPAIVSPVRRIHIPTVSVRRMQVPLVHVKSLARNLDADRWQLCVARVVRVPEIVVGRRCREGCIPCLSNLGREVQSSGTGVDDANVLLLVYNWSSFDLVRVDVAVDLDGVVGVVRCRKR